VTDTRLTEGLPLFGAYITPGETGRPTRLTAAELEKFNSIPGVYRIYDNGAIQVYDLSQLLGERPLVVPSDSVRSISATGTDVVVLVLAILVAAVWLLRLRRRARLVPIDAHMVVCWMVGALAIGLFGAFAILLTHLPPGPTAILCLLALLVLGLLPAAWRTHLKRNIRRQAASPPVPLESRTQPHMASTAANVAGTEAINDGPALKALGQPPGRTHRARSQLVLGAVGLALVAVGASFAVAAAREEWVPPPELSIAVGRGERPVASVDLGTAAPISAHLAVVARGRVLWSAPLSSDSTAQNVVLPADLLHPGSHVLLVAGGRTIRSVYG
jgi:hypothetical protein